MKSQVVIGDFGNSLLKVKDNDRVDREELVLPHAVVTISPTDFSKIQSQYGGTEFGDPSYFSFDDQCFVVGDAAEQYPSLKRLSSTSKYERNYLGALAIGSLLRLFPEGHDNLKMFVCQPPSDMMYRERQMDAVRGEFEIQTSGKQKVHYHIQYVNTYQEPLGGYMNVILDETGEAYDDVAIKEGRVLILDVGGRVSSVVPANPDNPDNMIEYGRADSIHYGLLNVLEALNTLLRKRYFNEFARTNVISADRLRHALRTGVYRGGGKELPCQEEVKQAMDVLINNLRPLYLESAGGPLEYDHILITGGGGAAADRYLRNYLLDHDSVFLAAEPEFMHLANVRGGGKFWKMLENNDLLV